jgi:competence protein ComFC
LKTTVYKNRFIARAANILRGGSYLLWPKACAVCGQTVAEDDCLCTQCSGSLLSCCCGDYCPTCGRNVSPFALYENRCPNCIGEDLFFDGIARCGLYDGTLQKLLLAFKSGRPELSSVLAEPANIASQQSKFWKQIDLFVPVPLHWMRRLGRGYNQAIVLAKKLRHPTAKINTDLVRIRKTMQQVSMVTASQRARNVAGAFAVRRGHQFAGKRICLVDDIKTTGATLNECARTLKDAGASNVFALVAAVAGQNPGR